jgi:hypothetical protein
MIFCTPTPDEINKKNGAHYRCRPCGASSGLRWYRGTSCPVCANPECVKALDAEWGQALSDMQRSEDD